MARLILLSFLNIIFVVTVLSRSFKATVIDSAMSTSYSFSNQDKTKLLASIKKTPAGLMWKPSHIRDFGPDDVLCVPGDLKKKNPSCQCCGGWEHSRHGLVCASEIWIDCSEQYKLSHYRPMPFHPFDHTRVDFNPFFY